jgi:hypothetical protein
LKNNRLACVFFLIIFVSAGCAQNGSNPASLPITVSIAPQNVAIATEQSTDFVATVTGDTSGVTWSVNGILGGNSTVGTIDTAGHYIAPPGPQGLVATITAASKSDSTKSASAKANVVPPGQVAPTKNVQVALYSISLPTDGKVSVQFGLDTNYGLTTWLQPAPANGGTVNLFVAGMKTSTLYHMRGVVQFADGSQFTDADNTFTTGALPVGTVPNITATTTAGMTPQSGVEVLDLLNLAPSPLLQAFVTDLNGNVIWAYDPGTSVPTGSTPQPIKLLPNGHFLISWVTATGNGIASGSVLQEVDLGSNLIWSMTSAQLNTALAAAACAECNVTIEGMHHDIAILPTGHLVVLADTTKTLSDGTTPTGDVVIDLGDMENVGGNNSNHVPQPAWAWNEFNHLDTNRRPYLYPDWTHTNAVIYSKDDGNLIISSRHQNWLVKIDYNNGAGSGDILWRLGFQGDFTLMNADGTPDANDTDWFFAQHDPSFVSTNTSGKFSLVLFDNGDDRGVVDTVGGTCGVSGQPACFSTVPIFDIDETAKTATFVIHPTTPDYSFFGGSAQVLKNGNVEYDECSNGSIAGQNGRIIEVTQTSSPQIVWQMHTTGQYAYRGLRIPSLYPGVQW